MVEEHLAYERRKDAIRQKNNGQIRERDWEEDAKDKVEKPRQVGISDVLSVGSKVVIGGGVGLLAGIATIAVVAAAGELILAGVVTKIAGVVGGAMGLTLGLGGIKRGKGAKVANSKYEINSFKISK